MKTAVKRSIVFSNMKLKNFFTNFLHNYELTFYKSKVRYRYKEKKENKYEKT